MLRLNWLLVTKGLHQVKLLGVRCIGLHQVALLNDNSFTRWRYTHHQVALEMPQNPPRGRRPGGLVVGRERVIKHLSSTQVLGLLETLTLKTIRVGLAGRSRLSLDFLSYGKT
jgi:hypothetical protein